MKVHTIICGSEKNKKGDAYYVNDQEKVWGLIYQAGLTDRVFSPEDYKMFEAMGFKMIDIVGEDTVPPGPKRRIQTEHVNIGMAKFSRKIKKIKPKRVLFNGRRALEWYYRYLHEGSIDKKSSRKYINIPYGKLPELLNGIDLYSLPATRNAGKANLHFEKHKEEWMKAWKDCLGDVEDLKIKDAY